MELITITISQWGLDLRTYFGDIYLPTRTFLILIGLAVILRAVKLYRGRK